MASRVVHTFAPVGVVAIVCAALPIISLAQDAHSKRPDTTVIVYDTFQKSGGYTLADYDAKWSTGFGLGEMALEDTRQFDNRTFSLSATPFRTGANASVFDHSKYASLSHQAFAVPAVGSITFSIDIAVETPGTIEGHVIHGTYVESGAPYAARVLQGQQAAATLHMIDFATGQLFDWFVAGNTAFTLIERGPPLFFGGGGIDEIYTQIIDEVPIAPGVPHTVAIRFTRDRHRSRGRTLLRSTWATRSMGRAPSRPTLAPWKSPHPDAPNARAPVRALGLAVGIHFTGKLNVALPP